MVEETLRKSVWRYPTLSQTRALAAIDIGRLLGRSACVVGRSTLRLCLGNGVSMHLHGPDLMRLLSVLLGGQLST
jgi:hypothetical protein